MTDASDVHLFAWISEHASIIGGTLAAAGTALVVLVKTIGSRYLTKEQGSVAIKAEISELRVVVDGNKAQAQFMQERIFDAIKEVRMDVRIMAKANAESDAENQRAHATLLLNNKKD